MWINRGIWRRASRWSKPATQYLCFVEMQNAKHDRASYVFTALGIAVQFLCMLVLIFGDIGFDKPGRYGLHATHTLALLVVIGFAFFVIALNEWLHGRWKIIVAELIAPFAIFAAGMIYSKIHSEMTRLEAKDYQHLVGKTQQQVHQVLIDGPRGMGGGRP
jgi:hypothetical protein